jgi:hypothetical protein
MLPLVSIRKSEVTVTERDVTGGMRVKMEHPLERHLLDIFGLDESRLFRLSRFILAHAVLDQYLIFRVVAARLKKAGKEFSEEEIRNECAAEADRNTFGHHLRHAIAEAGLPIWVQTIARDINNTRNGFLHWRPGGSPRPEYRGHDVTTDAGLGACLSDVYRVLIHGHVP